MKLIPKNNFLMLPNKLIEDMVKELKPSEFIVVVILFYLSQRFSTAVFHYTDAEIEKRFGISPATMNRARKALRGLRLIKYKSGFKASGYSVATRYKLLPDKRLRKLYRIRTNQKDRLDKPP